MNGTAPDLKTLFNQAIDIGSPVERAAYLDDACGQNAMLRSEVDALLAAAVSAGSFMDRPAVARSNAGFPPLIAEGPGTVIGPYKLLEQIGEGGMGVVFMAEQTQPVHRTVALKIIKPGMDTRQVIARFDAERQALAMMDHPNIAKVLDAGTTGGESVGCQVASEDQTSLALAPDTRHLPPTSRPYFVMDLVKGIPLTEYCDSNRFTVSQRLALFVQVCHAVQHAHQKGIIHRDLKPSNVLVAEYDGRPVPKVIDFGVAKATAQRLTERTMFTQYGQLIGTFEYMSPEQARFNQLDVDTRSDIYSLGVLLYELLTGDTPFERSRLETTPLDETLRIIREEEPPKPSTRLSASTFLAHAAQRTTGPLPVGGSGGEGRPSDSAAVAANRNTEPARLSRELRGELDWIVMKCLEKNRDRRYETASALASDIGHYLNNEPVNAGPPSKLYRTGKFVRRHRVPVVAALLVAAAILGGVAVSAWQAVRATRAERAALASAKLAQESAEREAAQRKLAEDISNFLISAYQVQEVQDPERDSQAVAEVLKHSAQKLQNAYPDNPAARAVLIANIARSYVRLRRFVDAEQMYRKYFALTKDPGHIGQPHLEFAECLLYLGQYDEATEILQAAMSEKVHGSIMPDAVELREAWSGLPSKEAIPRGKPGMKGLDLDGDHDYVILPRMYFDGRPPWTLEAIVRPIEIDQVIPATGSSFGWTSLVSAADGGSISLDTNQRRWAIELHTAVVTSDDWTKNYSVAAAKTEVALGEWQHVAGVWDGQQLRLYVNGQLQETRTGVDFCADLSPSPMFLGADPDALYFGGIAQGYLHGRLRVARISRAVEYTDSFTAPERLEKTPGTIGLYDFTIDTGRYAIDRSGHGNHGIIIGARFAPSDQ